MLRKLLPAFAIAALVVVALPALGPVSFGYVYSDSMEPTLTVDDGFILVSATDVVVGDIITYRTPQSGTLVTHRVVAVESDGYVTRGDANPSTDQAVGQPLVTDADIVGVVFEPRGRPLVIPGLGFAAGFVQSYLLVLLGGLAAVALSWEVLTRRDRPRRDVLRSGQVVWPVMLTTFVVAAVFVATGAVTYDVSSVVTETGVGNSLPVASDVVSDLSVSVVQSPIATLIVESEGGRVVGVEDATVPASALNPFVVETSRQTVRVPVIGATVPVVTGQTYEVPFAVRTPDAPGTVAVSLAVYPYPATLPESMLVTLHRVHPVVAAVVSVGAGLAPFAVAYWLLFDSSLPLRLPRTTGNRILERWLQ
ncbi:peptidase S26B, signal peptidase [Haloferax mucosum ATCC BAA-1512]|uniref:Peptidase S26B, signal peptidase n=1 Tax=Haloferax mucosum ATCC BAA-1512 TaxID=662479 RepID=M0IIC2_9EURY|nr:signal peptidase I [Haloferax mucosum]ELZ95807.1 peptidase S26B, signal peptidase [Haloferax mucosum ATCC BAA-1512]